MRIPLRVDTGPDQLNRRRFHQFENCFLRIAESAALRDPSAGDCKLQRAQEVQDVLHLRWVQPIEVTEDPVCFRATVRVAESIMTVISSPALPSTVGVRLDRLEQI